jgi:hypothetical protein
MSQPIPYALAVKMYSALKGMTNHMAFESAEEAMKDFEEFAAGPKEG